MALSPHEEASGRSPRHFLTERCGAALPGQPLGAGGRPPPPEERAGGGGGWLIRGWIFIITFTPVAKERREEKRPLLYLSQLAASEVQGWGKTDPLARFQLQNQAKKCKANETSNNCQFCLDVLPSIDNGIGQEAKTTRNQSKSEGQLSVGAIADTPSEKEEISTHSSKPVVLQHTALKWKYITSYTVETFQGEMKNPPIKRILYVEPGRCEKSRTCKA